MTETRRQTRRYTFTPSLLPEELCDVQHADPDSLTPEAQAFRQALIKLGKSIELLPFVDDRQPRIGLNDIQFFVQPGLQEVDELARMDKRIHNVLLEAARAGILFPAFKDKGLEVSEGSAVEVSGEAEGFDGQVVVEQLTDAQAVSYDTDAEPSAYELNDDDRRVLLRFCHFVLSTEQEVFTYRAADTATHARALRTVYKMVAAVADEYKVSDDRDGLFASAAMEIKLLTEIICDWPGIPRDYLPSDELLMKLTVQLFEQGDFFDAIKLSEAGPADDIADDRQVPRQRDATEG